MDSSAYSQVLSRLTQRQLQPQNREVLESVLKLVMKEMHSRGQMILSDRDVQQVYAWQLMPHIASEVTPLVDAIVHSLSVSFRPQTTP